MGRRINLIGLAAVGAIAGVSAPAAAFQFENGTIWPLAVGINGGPAQVVPPEEVAFLFRGQCPAGCQVNIAFADPSRAGTAVGGEPSTIVGNGDSVIVRVRQDRGGISVEVAGDTSAGAYTPPAGSVLTPPDRTQPGGTLPQQPAATQQSLPPAAATPPQSTVPALTAPPIDPAPTATLQPPAATTAPPASTSSGPAGFVPPPPPPEYSD